jgi:hypothetical protein
MRGVRQRPPPGGWTDRNPAPARGYRWMKEKLGGGALSDDELPPAAARYLAPGASAAARAERAPPKAPKVPNARRKAPTSAVPDIERQRTSSRPASSLRRLRR